MISRKPKRCSTRAATARSLKIGSNAVADDVAHVIAIKRALGERGDVRVDVNQAWSETDAIWAGARLAEAGVSLVEQPIAATNRAGLKRLTQLAQVPIMADERCTAPSMHSRSRRIARPTCSR